MANQECIFCNIVAGVIPSHTIYETDQHLAFLSIFPNTEGVTVVIPKIHSPSYIFKNAQTTIDELMAVTKTVALKIDQAYDDVGRCGVIFEGFGVDHLHAKLFPMHGTGQMETWKQIESNKPNEYFEIYPGYLSSHDCAQMDNDRLTIIADKIRNS